MHRKYSSMIMVEEGASVQMGDLGTYDALAQILSAMEHDAQTGTF